MPDWQTILDALNAADIAVDDGVTPVPVGGGDISAAWRLGDGRDTVFLKTGPLASLDLFTAERDALDELASAGAVRVPRARFADTAGDTAVLALEWLELGPADRSAGAALGRQLAALHRVTADLHGWHRDNFIGSTPQPNAQQEDWVAFFRDQRLRHQLALAAERGFGGRLQVDGERLAGRLPALFDGYEPVPSLLHGDLWGGNWGACNGEPVIYDPATYYGDRETDLAMTRLFGGFGAEFYSAYEEAWPLAAGHEARVALYQLYHVLNHLNLFGAGYLGRAEGLMQGLLSEVG